MLSKVFKKYKINLEKYHEMLKSWAPGDYENWEVTLIKLERDNINLWWGSNNNQN